MTAPGNVKASSTATSHFPGGSVVKNLPGGVGSIPWSGRSPGGGNASHPSILAWRLPPTEEAGGLQFLASQSDTTEVTKRACAHKELTLCPAHVERINPISDKIRKHEDKKKQA